MNAVAVNNRGAAYLIMGDVDHALAYFSEAIRLNPNYALAFNNRGMAWRDKGDLAHAVVDDRAAEAGDRLQLGARGRLAPADEVDDLREDEDVPGGRWRLHANSSIDLCMFPT